jgi:sigma54-dependent transcription regulator
MEAYDALVQQNTHNPSNKLSALLKEAELLKFECDIYDQYIDVHHAGYNKMMDRLERFDYIQKSAVKVEKVTKARLKRLAKEDCCICLSRHRPGDLVKTECQHMFGKSCFSALVKKSFFEDSEEVRCPLCRQEQQCLTVFVKRG